MVNAAKQTEVKSAPIIGSGVKIEVHPKKIANEPNLLRGWLLEKAEEISQSKLASEIEAVANLIDKDVASNQESTDQRARRKAEVVGLLAQKGPRPYNVDNIGLFRLINPRTEEVVAGHKFDLTANEAWRFCNSLNYSIFQFVDIPRDTYREDPEKYWRMKESAVDTMFERKIINQTGSLYEIDEDCLEDLDWDDPDELKAALVFYMQRANKPQMLQN